VELRALLVIVLTLILGAKVNAEGIRNTCTYQTFKWNVNLKGTGQWSAQDDTGKPRRVARWTAL
jgi:hypothetical protein